MVQRLALSLTTVPSAWSPVVRVTLATTSVAGIVAAGTGFVDPYQDWDPPATPVACFKPASALIFPALFEEVFWRGALLPTPPASPWTSAFGGIPWIGWACGVLVLHVVSHPVATRTVWPRGRDVFDDPRFLCLATLVLGGATTSYWISGGSVWAAALTHAVPVALWRDFFGGEAKLMGRATSRKED